jgi:thioesterase domain-containing protein
VTLFTPVEREAGVPSVEAFWRKHARTLSIVETAGDHSTMLSAPNATSTATSLTDCLPMEPPEHRQISAGSTVFGV